MGFPFSSYLLGTVRDVANRAHVQLRECRHQSKTFVQWIVWVDRVYIDCCSERFVHFHCIYMCVVPPLLVIRVVSESDVRIGVFGYFNLIVNELGP